MKNAYTTVKIKVGAITPNISTLPKIRATLNKKIASSAESVGITLPR